jgi:hypothetical protein
MKYKFTLDKEFKIFIPVDVEFTCEWGYIRSGKLTIKKGYSWDGCSPKFKIGKRFYGTWDGVDEELKAASLVHDFLYQFKGEHGITRLTTDLIFFIDMTKINFPLKHIYYNVVRCLGWIYGKWK